MDTGAVRVGEAAIGALTVIGVAAVATGAAGGEEATGAAGGGDVAGVPLALCRPAACRPGLAVRRESQRMTVRWRGASDARTRRFDLVEHGVQQCQQDCLDRLFVGGIAGH